MLACYSRAKLDERLGLSALIERHLTDPRTGHNRQFPLPDLFRQSIYCRLAGYEDTNDAERLAEDPTFRMRASRKRREMSVALTSTLHWFERCSARPPARAASDPGYRQLRESGPPDPRAISLQWSLRVRLLSSALRLQPARRLFGRHAPTRQRPQCGRVGGGPAARH